MSVIIHSRPTHKLYCHRAASSHQVVFLVSSYQVVFQIPGVKQLQEILKFSELIMESKFCLLHGSSSVSRDPEIGLRTMKMIRGVGCCSYLKSRPFAKVD